MDYSSKLSFLERLLGKAKYSYSSRAREALFFCPFCSHHKPKLSINLETDCWQDWVCGKGGRNLVYILRKAGGNRQDVETYLSKFKAKQVRFKNPPPSFSDFRVSLPEEFVPIVDCQNTFQGKRFYSYLTKVRKIDPDDILRHKIGMATTGDFRDRVIFPSFNKDGYLNHFAARSPRYGYMGPLDLPKGYEKTIIVNELNIDWDKPIVIVEGFIDMLKSVPNTIPLFGSFLPDDSVAFQRIVNSGVDVCLALDADATKKTDRIAERFTSWGASVYTLDVSPYEDMGKMSKLESKVRYENAQPWTKESSFREKLRALC